MNRAVFFDRDGVLNKLVSRDGGFFSPRTLDDFQLVPKAEDVINQIKYSRLLGKIIIATTNLEEDDVIADFAKKNEHPLQCTVEKN